MRPAAFPPFLSIERSRNGDDIGWRGLGDQFVEAFDHFPLRFQLAFRNALPAAAAHHRLHRARRKIAGDEVSLLNLPVQATKVSKGVGDGLRLFLERRGGFVLLRRFGLPGLVGQQ